MLDLSTNFYPRLKNDLVKSGYCFGYILKNANYFATIDGLEFLQNDKFMIEFGTYGGTRIRITNLDESIKSPSNTISWILSALKQRSNQEIKYKIQHEETLGKYYHVISLRRIYETAPA